MTRVFIHVFNMSFAGGCAVFIVMLLRWLCRRLPKRYVYGLWLAVLFRFLCPVVFHAPVSLLPVNPEPVRQEIVYQKNPEIQTGVIWVDRAVNSSVMESLAPESPVQSVNPIQIVLALTGAVWIVGMTVFFLYHLVQYVRMRRRLSTAVLMKDDALLWMKEDDLALVTEAAPASFPVKAHTLVSIRISDQIDGAFAMGMIRPVIYLPAGLDQTHMAMILRHEMVHIRRKDGLVKLLWLAAVMIHWFNPLVWLGFRLMCADMEMACDERALRGSDLEERKQYSRVLLEEAEQKGLVLLPLAFGKNSVSQRIQNILNVRRPGIAVLTAGGVLLAAAGIGLLVSPKPVPEKASGEEPVQSAGEEQDSSDAAAVSIIGGADGPTSIFLAGKLGGGSFDDAGENGNDSLQKRPDAQWLAGIMLKRPDGGTEDSDESEAFQDSGQGSEIVLDLAAEDALIFHGEFGLFAFQRDSGGFWRQNLFLADAKEAEAVADSLRTLEPEQNGMSGDNIHREDRLIGTTGSVDSLEYAAGKMADGRIAVLGVNGSQMTGGRLIDLWYGYFDPAEQVMKQVYLFLGNGAEFTNWKGETSGCQYLFSREGYDYFLRTPQNFLEFEQPEEGSRRSFHLPYDRLELVRSVPSGRDTEAQEEILDPLAVMQTPEHQKIVLTEERIVYTAAAEATNFSFKKPGLVSIRMDGSDRRTAEIPYQVYRGLSYADGALYYEGWTNDGAFPRPLYRMKPDFTEQEQVGELNGSLMTVENGGICWQLDWDQMQILVGDVERLEEFYPFLAAGKPGRYARCEMGKVNGYTWKVEVIPLEQEDGEEAGAEAAAGAKIAAGAEAAANEENVSHTEKGPASEIEEEIRRNVKRQTFYLQIPSGIEPDGWN